ncbi:DNA polymerase I, phage-associated [Xylella phage Cota]|uniref:DNA polymerase I, phage-associated n=1 Tax=Xylella phage Cota TaxID=2699877 RepID=A0A6F8ZKP3_9CAUD|nr:DNA polymerase I, phage-associated [Xylella phage Cota]
MTYVVWDVETTIKTYNKRKASPFHPENHIVASGFKRKGMTKAVADYFGRKRPEGDWFRKLLAGTKMLVGFNIKFDLLHALRDEDNYTAWVEYVANGGRVWDCQLAEYLLHGMEREHHMLSLDEVAPRYGGHLKNDAVKALWEAGIDTTEIDPDLLLEYLIGAPNEDKDLGDIGNTEAVFLGQVDALRARKGLNSVLLNMDSLLCTTEMERNGMFINKKLGLELAEQLEIELQKLRAELHKSLPEDLPFEFNWGSRFHLSALVFGGKIKYVAKETITDDEGNLVYYQLKEKHYVLNDGSTTATPPSGTDALNYATFTGGKNKGEYKTKQVTVPDIARGPKQRNADFYFEFPGYTEPSPEWESSTPGVYSVASEVIEALGNRDIPFLKSLAEMASLVKDLGTYYITTDPETGESKGMLTLVGDDSIIHHSLNHTSTVTGRFSSSNPNLQNVPKEGKSQVKSVFVSRFSMGKIIQSDFTALEIYVQGNLTGDKRLIQDLIDGLDMHCLRAATTFGADYDFVLLASKDENHPEHKLWKKRRTNSKVFSFQRAYGAGAAKIAATTGMPIEEVEALIAAEEKLYPAVTAYYERVTQKIAENRVPTQRFVQHPEIAGITCQLGRSHFTTPDGKVYSYSEQPSPGWLVRQKKITQSFSPTEIKNYVVQGTGGEWAKAAMALAVRAFYAHKNFGGRSLLVNQVHDALYLDSSPEVEVQSAALLHACMEEASAYMSKLFNWNIAVPVPTETKSGASMIEEHDLPEGFKLQVKSYRTWVRDNYMPGFVPSFEKGE